MIGYYAGSTNKKTENFLLQKGIKTRLRSYVVDFNYGKTKNIITFPNLFLDSGAFTALTQGVKIDLLQYSEFIKFCKPKIAATLDVIGDFETTKRNYNHLRDLGCNVLPVFHYGASKKEINYWLDSQEYIAIGGLVPHARQRKKIEGFLDLVFSLSKNKWPVKFHCFGLWSNWVHMKYPFYSADSTSWLAFSKYGNHNKLLDKNLGEVVRRESGHAKLLYEVKYFQKQFLFYTNLWKKRGIKWD